MKTYTDAGGETFSFEAEVTQLLDLMVHSLYSNKDVFLRELISNASDAIDRLRLERYAHPEMTEPDHAPWIRVGFDRDAGTITIADNGVGMSRAEVIDHLGTIARSGTSDFLRALTGDQRGSAEAIGQFGVGFYSAFVVADQVVLTTRRAGLDPAEAVRWTSDGRGTYTLEPVERAERGTTVVLHLRDGQEDLLNEHRLRTVIRRFCDHINRPIFLGGTEPAAGEEPVNQAAAFWSRPKSELAERDYHEHYRSVTHDTTDPLAYLHSKVEGQYEYTLLLYIPGTAPYDLWLQQARSGVKLHVQRVFVLEDSGQLLPEYLRFVRGVIDSADLPLNVSREILQSSRAVDHIRSTAVKKVLRLLRRMATDEPDKYATFWEHFGSVLKEGMAEDPARRDELADLLRFPSTHAESVSLREYADRMKEGQDKIYYLLAPTLADAGASPHLEAYRAKGVEVLLLGEVVDSWVVTGLLQAYDGKRLQSVAQGDPAFGDLEDAADKERAEQADATYAGLLDKLRTVLRGRAWDVRVSTRLTSSPACIVSDGATTDAGLVDRLQGNGIPSRPILEINPDHTLVDRLDRHQDDPRFDDLAHVLFDQGVLTLGGRLEDPAAFVTRLNALLSDAD
ncbi:molecular chaperone HtpG [Streptomyces ossamyceticus]|nr:molecular chaperone HtpG [Streptomyces ossamyceticus]